jgi:ArsR family transcriptional regulator
MDMKAAIPFKALCDDTRLRLANVLNHYELNVNQIVAVMQMGQSRISRHLKILTDGGFIRARRDGMRTYYSAEKQGEGFRFLEAVRYIFSEDPSFDKDLKSAKRVFDESHRETMRFFEAIAEDWEGLKETIFGGFDLSALIVRHLTPIGTVVDLGCGTGDLLAHLRNRASRVIGVDRSSKMLEEAQKNLGGSQSAIDLRLGGIEHLPLRDSEADGAVVNMVLHHLSSPPSVFIEVNRILKMEGQFLIIDFLKHEDEEMRTTYGDHWLGFNPDEVGTWLKESGFSPVNTETFDLQRGLKGFIVSSKKSMKYKVHEDHKTD